MEWLFDIELWIALLTLTLLEIVLGIDNIVFLTILAGKLPPSQQHRAQITGLALAMITRILLLLSITWIMKLTSPFFELFGNQFSGRDCILILGGLFLLGKSTHEIHGTLEGFGDRAGKKRSAPTFAGVISQIIILDVVFSLDSVITAVGMTNRVGIMIAAVIVAVLCMMVFAEPIGRFVGRHPTVKMLALSFLLLIGVSLIGEGFDQHIPKGYIYFAMAFSVIVEMLNLRVRRRAIQ